MSTKSRPRPYVQTNSRAFSRASRAYSQSEVPEEAEGLIGNNWEELRSPGTWSEPPNIHAVLSPYENWIDYLTALPSFVRGYIGSALLAIPYCFYQTGVFWGLILTFICCIINYYLMKLIAITCDDCNVSKNGWGNMCGVIGGKRLKLLAEISLLVSQLGTCIGETMFALKFLNYAFCGLKIESMCEHNLAHIGMILLIIIPLTAITNMRYLSYPNELADFATLFFMGVTFYIGIDDLGSFGAFWDNVKEGFFQVKLGGTISFMGTLLYAVGGVGAILDVRNSMRNTQQFYSVLRNGFIIIGLTFSGFGAINALVAFDDTKQIYLYNLPVTKLSLISQIIFLLTITMTYITNQFPCMTILESWMDPKDIHFHSTKTIGGLRWIIQRYAVRYVLVAFVLSIAAFLPSFNLFLSLIGSYNFAVMSGLLPVITYNIHFKGRMSMLEEYFNVFIMLVCLIFGGIGMVQAIQSMATE